MARKNTKTVMTRTIKRNAVTPDNVATEWAGAGLTHDDLRKCVDTLRVTQGQSYGERLLACLKAIDYGNHRNSGAGQGAC